MIVGLSTSRWAHPAIGLIWKSERFFFSPESQVFHFCHGDGKQDTFYCGYGTIFNEYLGTCDYKNNVYCSSSGKGYSGHLPDNTGFVNHHDDHHHHHDGDLVHHHGSTHFYYDDDDVDDDNHGFASYESDHIYDRQSHFRAAEDSGAGRGRAATPRGTRFEPSRFSRRRLPQRRPLPASGPSRIRRRWASPGFPERTFGPGFSASLLSAPRKIILS